jgi:hypothetical protein
MTDEQRDFILMAMILAALTFIIFGLVTPDLLPKVHPESGLEPRELATYAEIVGGRLRAGLQQ